MNDSSDETKLTRREVVAAGLGAAAALAMSRFGMAQRPQKGKILFQLGLQSYTLREMKWQDAAKRAHQLGIKHWEAFPGHIPTSLDPKVIDGYKADLKAAGISTVAYGVCGFGGDKEANKQLFEFAKKMGIQTLSADPAPESFAQLEELVEEFGVNIAIHNHGPGARYSKIEDVVKAVEGKHARIGACIDTGHFLRSGEDPVKAVKALSGRIWDVHLKDFADEHTEKVLGEGKLDIRATMEALRDAKYRGLLAIEFELDPEKDNGLQRCISAARKVVEALS
jgi:inosose dehydratase